MLKTYTMTAADFLAVVSPINHDAHVKAWYARQRLAAATRASDEMAAAIARAGSVTAFLAQERARQ